jgi:hypothetical protein
MTIRFKDSWRTAVITSLQTEVGSGGKIHIYGGTQPAKGGTAPSPLVTFTCADTLFSSIVNGVGTVDVSGMAEAALAGGAGTLATWARLTTSGGTFIADMTVSGTGGGGDLTMDNTTIIFTGTPSTITSTSLTITAMGA